MTESDDTEAWEADLERKLESYRHILGRIGRLENQMNRGSISKAEAMRRLKPFASTYLALRTDEEFLAFVHVKLEAIYSALCEREARGEPMFGDPDIHAAYERLIEVGLDAPDINSSVSALTDALKFVDEVSAEAG